MTSPHATAWATKTDLCVSLPTPGGEPYVVRYPLTVTGLASALNILIQHPEPITTTAPQSHPIINASLIRPPKGKVGTEGNRRTALEIVRSMFK